MVATITPIRVWVKTTSPVFPKEEVIGVPDQPRYQQIADTLREEIHTGRLAPGTKLPSETQLVERFGASRDTVRDSTKLLIQAGLVEQRGLDRSGGMWVIEPRILTFHAS